MSIILSVATLLEWNAKKHQLPELDPPPNPIEIDIDRVLLNTNERTSFLGGHRNTNNFSEAVAKKK